MILDFFHNLIKTKDNKRQTIEEENDNLIADDISQIKDIKSVHKIDENEIELAQKLNAIEEYTIDRFEDDIAVLENRETRQIKNVNKEELPNEIKEGSILKCINGKYFLSKESEEEIANRIEEKMNDLWND